MRPATDYFQVFGNPDKTWSTSFLNGFSITDQLTDPRCSKENQAYMFGCSNSFFFNHGSNVDAFDLTRIGLSHHEFFMTLRNYVKSTTLGKSSARLGAPPPPRNQTFCLVPLEQVVNVCIHKYNTCSCVTAVIWQKKGYYFFFIQALFFFFVELN